MMSSAGPRTAAMAPRHPCSGASCSWPPRRIDGLDKKLDHFVGLMQVLGNIHDEDRQLKRLRERLSRFRCSAPTTRPAPRVS